MSSMDCLSNFFTWDPPIQLQDCFIPDMDMIIPETDSFFFQSQPQMQFHQPFVQEEAPSQTFIELTDFDSFSDQFLPPQETHLPYPKAETFDEIHYLDSFLPTPKRQKLVNSSYHCNTFTHFPNPNLDIVQQASVFPEFRVHDIPLVFKAGLGDQDGAKKPKLSSQSMAARERRRRIAEKTHELTKLVPGGQKLNTAEMFQAAAKYVKFLQSQVGILQMMQTTKKVTTSLQKQHYKLIETLTVLSNEVVVILQTQGITDVEIETQFLLESQAVQEKLSMKELCLVPCEIVRDLTSEESIWRNPKISREIDKLLSTDLAN
ncbi:transcription factor bHLH53 [Brassica rapa]|uniref:transcription factor bHLH53 n=1 Tax=Brassica campestris TaxID=3711 RepID=UPI00142E5F6A|nr:transcription factor bHLH53 [Brassica rapa]XP_048631261.1 transcription factor bHLH53-like [Brassica napus]